MNRVELEGVLAHELSHVKNYDILVTTIAVTAVGTIALIADLGLRFMFWGGAQRPPRQQRRRRRSASILAIARARAADPRAVRRATLMQFAMSRNREYLADASRRAAHPVPARPDLGAGEAAGRPGGRAPRDEGHRADVDRAAARDRRDRRHAGSKFNHLFDTHPPLDDRIAAWRRCERRSDRSRPSRRHRARRGAGRCRRVAACGGGDDEAATPKPTHDHDGARPPPRSRRPIAPLTGLPDPGGAQPRPARAVGEGREHPDVATADRHRPGRRRLRGGRRGQHHPLPRDLQLQVPDVIGPVRSVRADGPRHRVARRRDLRLLGRRAGARRRDQRRAGARGRRGRRAAGAMLRNRGPAAARRAAQPLRRSARRCSTLGGDPMPPPALFQYRRRRRTAPSAGRRVIGFRVGFLDGYDPT